MFGCEIKRQHPSTIHPPALDLLVQGLQNVCRLPVEIQLSFNEGRQLWDLLNLKDIKTQNRMRLGKKNSPKIIVFGHSTTSSNHKTREGWDRLAPYLAEKRIHFLLTSGINFPPKFNRRDFSASSTSIPFRSPVKVTFSSFFWFFLFCIFSSKAWNTSSFTAHQAMPNLTKLLVQSNLQSQQREPVLEQSTIYQRYGTWRDSFDFIFVRLIKNIQNWISFSLFALQMRRKAKM